MSSNRFARWATAAGTVAMLGMGGEHAGAWVSAPGHVGSGVLRNGTVTLTLTNTFAGSLDCTYKVWPAEKYAGASEVAREFNAAHRAWNIPDDSAGNTHYVDGRYKQDALGAPLTKGKIVVGPKSSKSVTWRPAKSAGAYTGFTFCNEMGKTTRKLDHLTVDSDSVAFMMGTPRPTPKPTHGGNGSLGGIFGS